MTEHLSDIQVPKKRMSTYIFRIYKSVNLTSWKKVKNLILKEIKEATYFLILFDSTPDVSHYPSDGF